MSEVVKKYQRYFKNDLKLDLSYNGLMNQNELFDILKEDSDGGGIDTEKIKELTNPLFYLLENYENIKTILTKYNINRMEYCYLNRKKISSILYDEDKTLTIDSNILKDFFDYYHLYLMIKENSEITNYIFDFPLIKNLNDLRIQEKGIKRLILAKMTIYLINNYRTLDEFDSDHGDDCTRIIEECQNVIKNEKEVFNKNKNEIIIDDLDNEDLGIDELYCEILVSLIKNNKLNDANEEILNLLNELGIKNLRLNKIIVDGLKKVLIAENLKDYIIETYKDLFDDEKLSFYYMLFSFILKSSDYVFHIPFLYETRKKIKELINKNGHKFTNDLKKLKKDPKLDKINIVLNYFIELKYYLEKQKKNKESQREENAIKEDNRSNQSSQSNNQSNQSGLSSLNQSQSNYSGFNSSSSANNNSSSGSNLFDSSSYRNGKEQNPNSFSNYESNLQVNNDIKEEQAYQILSNSTFVLTVVKQSGQDKAKVTFKEIAYIPKENTPAQKIDYEDLKKIDPDNSKLKINYKNFKNYLEQVENELKGGYKNTIEITIDMKFKMQNDSTDFYNINCEYFIHDMEDNEYKDENFLNSNGNYNGLNCLIIRLSED